MGLSLRTRYITRSFMLLDEFWIFYMFSLFLPIRGCKIIHFICNFTLTIINCLANNRTLWIALKYCRTNVCSRNIERFQAVPILNAYSFVFRSIQLDYRCSFYKGSSLPPNLNQFFCLDFANEIFKLFMFETVFFCSSVHSRNHFAGAWTFFFLAFTTNNALGRSPFYTVTKRSLNSRRWYILNSKICR